MSLLNTLGLKSSTKVLNEADYAPAKSLLNRLERGAFIEAEMLLQKASFDSLDRLIYTVASHNNSLKLAQEWAGKHPKSAFANIFQGAALLTQGWKIRGSNYAEDVDDSAWAAFFQHLESAEDSFVTAAKLAPTLPDPYAWLLTTGMGLSAEPDVIYARFLEATNRESLHFPAHYRYFPTITDKWGGSDAQMFAFVRKCSSEAPTGSMLHILVAMAYNELALSYSEKGFRYAQQTLGKKDHATECVKALYQWLGATAETLNDKLNLRSDAYASVGLNHFGLALYMTGAHKEAYLVMQALGDEIMDIPWAWIGEGLKERFSIGFTFDRIHNELRKKFK